MGTRPLGEGAIVPTGVAIRDARRHLFEAAERVLLREGPLGLTSRAVTTEAGVAKGVLHRHFADFDAFLIELVLDRIAGVETRAAALLSAAGTRTVTANLTDAVDDVFGPVAVAIVGLITFRDDLRARLREMRPGGIPLLAEATEMVAGYLTAERSAGRLPADADVGTMALMLIGGANLIFTGSPPGERPTLHEVTRMVESALR
jgi:AcrR family transcriptional regulator